jgi:segregation and condensation protein A
VSVDRARRDGDPSVPATPEGSRSDSTEAPDSSASNPGRRPAEAKGEGRRTASRPGLKRAPGSETKPQDASLPVKTGRSENEAHPESSAPEGAVSDTWRVTLPSFEGPLDLLLHLIQKHELDILNIPVSFITEKYLEYLAIMRELSIDLASEYLVMAATLAHIKSKMLLPDVPETGDDAEQEEEEDPRADLIRRLLEYQKYKAAAEDLGRRETLGKDVFPRGSEEIAPVGPAPFAEIGTFELLNAFAKLLERNKTKIEHEIVFDRISISDRITELTAAMKARTQMPFEDLFQRGERAPSRFDLIITFLAVLEMARLKMLRIYQAESLSSIFVELSIVTDDDGEVPHEELQQNDDDSSN